MLESTKLQTRQSEIRQKLATFQVAGELTPAQQTEVRALTAEYTSNEAKYQAALVSEDETRQQATKELEQRGGDTWGKLVQGFELRQIVAALDTGDALSGQTAEAVQELRAKGSYQGLPIPLAALETRAGETTSTYVPDPTRIGPIIPRLFPQSAAAQMGASIVNIDSGSNEYPVLTDGVTTGWASTETGNVGSATQVKTGSFQLEPAHTLGTQAIITRRALKQAGDGLEQAIRRDLSAAIQAAIDKAVFLGSGTGGEPNGIVSKASTYGITVSDKSAATVTYAAILAEAAAMMTANVTQGPGGIRVLARPEFWTFCESSKFDTGSGLTLWDKIAAKMGAITLSGSALADPVSDVSNVLLTTSAGGIAPIYVGIWGGLDLLRDPFTKAASGQLVLTGLLTMDVTASRAAQLRVIKTKHA